MHTFHLLLTYTMFLLHVSVYLTPFFRDNLRLPDSEPPAFMQLLSMIQWLRQEI